MNSKDGIRQIDFEQVNDIVQVDYADSGIAFHRDIKELPIGDGAMRVNMYTIVACTKGRLQVELNAKPYVIRQNEVLVCKPNDVVDNFMLSPDFDGVVLCLSQRGILEQISENELWDKAFRLAENPVVRTNAESLRMFYLYGAAILEKVKMKRTPYYREIIVSMVKAALYELLANVDGNQAHYCSDGLVTQKEVLFKRFIDLLSTSQVKPRSVSWYGEQLCVTSKYLSTVCKQVSGKTAFGWINENILVNIRYWLKNTSKTVKEIADILEFPNISFFGKYCRAHFGISPTELRKQLRDIPADNNAQLK